ncbi:hypothetical protein AZZ62_003573, partial [Klebsiella variicola]
VWRLPVNTRLFLRRLLIPMSCLNMPAGCKKII